MIPKHPILNRHLELGHKAFSAISSWRGTFEALEAMAKSFPEHEGDACVWKVAAINGLLGTRLPDAWMMAQHVQKVMTKADLADRAALIERLSKPKDIRHWSFASKYAHFFIDPGRFPIYDSYVREAVAFHLADRKVDPKGFAEFLTRLDLLKDNCDPQVGYRELDHYLWIAEQYRRRGKPGVKLNPEVENFIAKSDGTLFRMLGNQM